MRIYLFYLFSLYFSDIYWYYILYYVVWQYVFDVFSTLLSIIDVTFLYVLFNLMLKLRILY